MKRITFFLVFLTTFVALAASVQLAWDYDQDAEAPVRFNIYIGPASGDYSRVVDAGTNLTFRVAGLIPGRNYFFAATAYTVDGLESDYSNEVSYTPEVGKPTNLRLAP